ncbi:MAG: 4'-phosphopantetheinyl transferase superfamily protein [Nitrosomonas sp.]|uniref:4'-phosphopantetheinyl transferase family protein n=1 Tax=Nitrosomonas sp. TaxID=42353 RepID=UPI0027360EC3|nr:4'-phosphopantetheinyl transferase superfamily protein [Nitrosomonas sp.]MDP3662968.1 4'-phosphopantetheinyl transferase superfamily protein [Nitrosomonas sp.]MDZ4106271.1 4'-phosphopantetheinyl transferase superfamily protein [Nitrosomonas sp.]
MQRLHLPRTVPAGIEVWLLKFNFDSTQFIDDWPLLSVDEQMRAQRFRQHEDQVRSIVTRAALRRLLAEWVMSSPHDIQIELDKFGKPRLPAYYGVEFNVSHAGDFALIALSTQGEIGVDIEYRHRDVSNLCIHVLSPVERARRVWSNENFIDLWVAKESVLKALGFGITEYLQAITVLPDHGGSYHVMHDQTEWAEVKAWSIDAPIHYAAALALTRHRKLELERHPFLSCFSKCA